LILVDTSVWVDHLRFGRGPLGEMLEQDLVLTHPFVIGELACGHLRPRAEILRHLRTLPAVTVARNTEVLRMIEAHGLPGSGLGWVDAHLLAAALISGAKLLTLDRVLQRIAWRIGVASS
jgi:predicted nucleic acid-binding protein